MPYYGPTTSVPVEHREVTEADRELEKTKQASSGATKIVYILMGIVLLALLIITMVGPHVPAGE